MEATKKTIGKAMGRSCSTKAKSGNPPTRARMYGNPALPALTSGIGLNTLPTLQPLKKPNNYGN